MEGPLLLVLELGLVRVFVIGSIEVGHTGTQARFHDGQVLVGQCHMDQYVGLERLNQGDQCLDIVGIHLRGLYGTWQLGGNGFALLFIAAGQHDFAEHLGMLGALVGNDTADATSADNQDFAHGPLESRSGMSLKG